MKVTAGPDVIDALVTAAQADLTLVAAEVDVLDGNVVADEIYYVTLCINLDDPLGREASTASTASQAALTVSSERSRQESGAVTCCVYSWNGDNDWKAARDAAFAAMNAMAAIVHATPDLGLQGSPDYMSLVAQFGDWELSQRFMDPGVYAVLIFTITYSAYLNIIP